jgi:hypothetical protein
MAFRGRGGAGVGARGGLQSGGSTGSLQSAGASEAPKIAGVEWLADTITCHAWNADRTSMSLCCCLLSYSMREREREKDIGVTARDVQVEGSGAAGSCNRPKNASWDCCRIAPVSTPSYARTHTHTHPVQESLSVPSSSSSSSSYGVAIATRILHSRSLHTMGVWCECAID